MEARIQAAPNPVRKTLFFREEGGRSIGRPAVWTKARVLGAVRRLCRGRYLPAKDFPPYLYKLCKLWCGSVRAAKWEANVIPERPWSRQKFLRWVRRFAASKYRDNRHWPDGMRALAKRFFGSIRKAKWEAGVIEDPRARERSRSRQEGLWDKKKFLRKFYLYCCDGFKKPSQIPGHMRGMAVLHCGSVRAAKWQARVLRDARKSKRRTAIPTP